jgi:hypothetical protein
MAVRKTNHRQYLNNQENNILEDRMAAGKETQKTPMASLNGGSRGEKEFNSGCMPHTDFKYEELEGLLGGFYLTLKPLAETGSAYDRKGFTRAVEILNEIAKEHGIQTVEGAVNNPRAKEAWGRPSVFLSNLSTLDMFRSFVVDFGIFEQHEQGIRELYGIILDAYERHGIANVIHSDEFGKRVPIRIESWNEGYDFRTLGSVLLAERLKRA